MDALQLAGLPGRMFKTIAMADFMDDAHRQVTCRNIGGNRHTKTTASVMRGKVTAQPCGSAMIVCQNRIKKQNVVCRSTTQFEQDAQTFGGSPDHLFRPPRAPKFPVYFPLWIEPGFFIKL